METPSLSLFLSLSLSHLSSISYPVISSWCNYQHLPPFHTSSLPLPPSLSLFLYLHLSFSPPRERCLCVFSSTCADVQPRLADENGLTVKRSSFLSWHTRQAGLDRLVKRVGRSLTIVSTLQMAARGVSVRVFISNSRGTDVTFSHLADAFVQSDVQGREQSS